MLKNVPYLFAAAFIVLVGCTNKSSDNTLYVPSDPVNTYFQNEVTPHSQATCAQGSYYKKITSSLDKWRGITGTVILPTINFDSSRKNPSNSRQFLDNPSIYIGGNANGQETDIGLTWEVIKDATGAVTADRRAFRPFMRRTGYSSTGQASLYANAPLLDNYYWYPGETVTMTVKVVSDGVLQFTVEGNSKKFDTTFAADGYTMNAPAIFKRVNAIDQTNNEGKPVQPSKTQVVGAKWTKTSLLRMYNDTLTEAPMHSGRYTTLICPGARYFTILASDAESKQGAETITIDAGK